jgi:hypothetical protein
LPADSQIDDQAQHEGQTQSDHGTPQPPLKTWSGNNTWGGVSKIAILRYLQKYPRVVEYLGQIG